MSKKEENSKNDKNLKNVETTPEGHLLIDGRKYIPILDEEGLEEIKENCELENLIYHALNTNPLMRSLKEKYSELEFKKIFQKYFADGLYQLERDTWYTLEQKPEDKPFIFRLSSIKVPKINSRTNINAFVSKPPHLSIVDFDKNTNFSGYKEVQLISPDEAIVFINSEFVKNIRISTEEEIASHLLNVANDRYNNKSISPVVMSDDFTRSIKLPQIIEEISINFKNPLQYFYDSLNDTLISVISTSKGLGYFALYSKGIWATIKEQKEKLISVDVEVLANTNPNSDNGYISSLKIEESKYDEFVEELSNLLDKYDKSEKIPSKETSKDCNESFINNSMADILKSLSLWDENTHCKGNFIVGCDLAMKLPDELSIFEVRIDKNGKRSFSKVK